MRELSLNPLEVYPLNLACLNSCMSLQLATFSHEKLRAQIRAFISSRGILNLKCIGVNLISDPRISKGQDLMWPEEDTVVYQYFAINSMPIDAARLSTILFIFVGAALPPELPSLKIALVGKYKLSHPEMSYFC